MMILVILPLLASCGSGGGGGDAQPPASSSASSASSTAAANRAPVAGADSAAVTGSGGSVAVMANDIDPDGDTVRLIAVTTPAHGSARIDDRGTALPADDVIVYTPAAAFTGTDSFTYTIADDAGLSAIGRVTVTVTAVAAPQPVVARDDSAETPAGQPVSVAVLDNDSGGA
jgi:hypothetical protein